MKKMLIVSTVSGQFYLFEQGNIEVLHSLGYEIHAAANFSDAKERLDTLDVVRHHFDIQRSPFSFTNIKAYKQLVKIMKSDNFDGVHCHSPMGGVLARLAAKATGICKVIYTAHGFHFYKGAPLINWLVYYPIEKILSRYTDVLITLNKEDHARANSFFAKKSVHVPGIGLNTERFSGANIDRDKIREEIGIPGGVTVLLSIGEMIKRKNHETSLKALAKLKDENFVYLICGRGELADYLKNLAVIFGLKDKVRFLGYRNDIPEICKASDVFLFPSYQEGLPVSVMEAMAVGLPIICSSIRGNTDLIEDGKGGFLVDANDVDGFADRIKKMLNNSQMRETMGKRNIDYVKQFSLNNVKAIMEKIYSGLKTF